MIARFCAGICTFALLVASACSTATSAQTSTPNARAASLPGLPSGSRIDGDNQPLPEAARSLLAELGCTHIASAAVVSHVLDRSGKASVDYLAADAYGTRYRVWIRSFAGTDGTTGYLVQLHGCPADTAGMRAYTVKSGGRPVDVTDEIVAHGMPVGPAAMARYQAAGASELFAETALLGRTPVVRWISEADPDRGLPEDARTLANGFLVHGGFLRWEDNRFILSDTVPARLWPCGKSGAGACIDGDRFVTN